jgi:hypothetical protein
MPLGRSNEPLLALFPLPWGLVWGMGTCFYAKLNEITPLASNR